jgi:hypothetical protein
LISPDPQASPLKKAADNVYSIFRARRFDWLISQIKSWVKVPVEVHCHNNWGLATVATFAGIAAGAEVVHTCINGMGGKAIEVVLGKKSGRYSIMLKAWEPGLPQPSEEQATQIVNRGKASFSTRQAGIEKFPFRWLSFKGVPCSRFDLEARFFCPSDHFYYSKEDASP